MKPQAAPPSDRTAHRCSQRMRRATVLLMVVGLLAMLFIILTAYISLARFDRVSLVQEQRGQEMDRIVKGVQDLTLSLMRNQWTDAQGRLLRGGGGRTDYSFEDIPGWRGSRWLGASQPIRPWSTGGPVAGLTNPNWVLLTSYRIPGATQLTPTARDGRNVPGELLMVIRSPLRSSFNYPAPSELDFTAFIERPYMDADGDGIIDAFYPAMALAIEAANAEVRTPVRAPDSMALSPRPAPPYAVSQFEANRNLAMFTAYEDQARFDVAVRAISHGGMVTLGYDDSAAWNAQFSRRMFDWIAWQNGAGTVDLPGVNSSVAGFDNLVVDLVRNRSAVEPLLRRRGGLATARINPTAPLASTGRVPYALQAFEAAFPRTTLPLAYLQGFPYWQRHNMGWVTPQGDLPGYRSWLLSNVLEADAYNRQPADRVRQVSLEHYNRRSLLTTVNNSDELSRVQLALSVNSPPANRFGVVPGQPKFYLGDITGANTLSDPAMRTAGGLVGGAFVNDPAGAVPVGAYDLARHRNVGNSSSIIRQLADQFSDMLAGHDWSRHWGPNGAAAIAPRTGEPPYDKLVSATFPIDNNHRSRWQILTRRQQALMLAVNTVAFAAPRLANGFIDLVVAEDTLGAEAEELPQPAHPLPDGDLLQYDGLLQRGDTQPAKYFGYGPQPYITQVFAHGLRRPGPTDPADPDATGVRYSVAVELFNPNDPELLGTADDQHALYLPQFAISVNSTFQPDIPATYANLVVLSPNSPNVIATGLWTPRPRGDGSLTRMPGRDFFTVVIDTTPGALRTAVQNAVSLGAFPGAAAQVGSITSGPSNEIHVKLWKLNYYAAFSPQGNWPALVGQVQFAQVDELRVPSPDPPTIDPNDPDAEDTDATENVWRDTDGEIYFGPPTVQTQGRVARWRCVMGLDDDDDEVGSDRTLQAPAASQFYQNATATGNGLGGEGPFHRDLANPFAPPTRFGPTIPLYCMNAGFGTNSAIVGVPVPSGMSLINGALRPSSFPTPGFMLFVPRFAHTATYPAPGLFGVTGRSDRPMSRWLREEWVQKQYTDSRYPLDFGHMPIFDNKQLASESIGYFQDPNAGRVPWGLLAFDYFTTHNVNPADPGGVNVNELGGRININVAPWYVLSGLPTIVRPVDPNNLPLSLSASPAFRTGGDTIPTYGSGILVGRGQANSRRRYDYWMTDFGGNGSRLTDDGILAGSWRRLGANLAQAAVSYRDRIGMVSNDDNVNTPGIPYAWWRRENITPTRPLRFPLIDYPTSNASTYGSLRGNDLATITSEPKYFGFLSVGELINVRGFANEPDVAGSSWTLETRDFFGSIGTLVLLDTHFLTTRSNTFTIYTAINDRQNPQGSIRSQITVDRTNLLPRLYRIPVGPGVESRSVVQDSGLPQTIAERRIGYLNTQFDE